MEVTMEQDTIIILTRLMQIVMFIPIIMWFRQLYKDVYDNESDPNQDPDSD